MLGELSRLYIDLNRDSLDPTLIPVISDRKIILGNIDISKKDLKKRMQYYYKYHNYINELILKYKIKSIISLHSFNPIFKNNRRLIDFGVLSNSDFRLSKKIIAQFEKRNIFVGNNEPYKGNLIGDTLYKHGLKNKISHSLIEVRNDLLNTKVKVTKVSDLLKKVISSSLKQ